jgi:hypothetical protein
MYPNPGVHPLLRKSSQSILEEKAYFRTRHGDLDVVPLYQLPPHSSLESVRFKPKEKTICGVRRKTFIVLVVLGLVIVASAIAGGVGGAFAVERAKT